MARLVTRLVAALRAGARLAAARLVAVPRAVVLREAVPRVVVRLAVVLRAVVLRAVVLRAVVLRAVLLVAVAVALRAVVFLAGAFLAAVFLAAAVVRFAVVRFAVVRLAVVARLAVVFLAAFFAAGRVLPRVVAFFAAGLRAVDFLAAVLRAVVVRLVAVPVRLVAALVRFVAALVRLRAALVRLVVVDFLAATVLLAADLVAAETFFAAGRVLDARVGFFAADFFTVRFALLEAVEPVRVAVFLAVLTAAIVPASLRRLPQSITSRTRALVNTTRTFFLQRLPTRDCAISNEGPEFSPRFSKPYLPHRVVHFAFRYRGAHFAHLQNSYTGQAKNDLGICRPSAQPGHAGGTRSILWRFHS